MPRKSTTVFIVCALIWEVAVGIIYGLFIRYNQTTFASMQSPSTVYYYPWSTSPTTTSYVQTNTTQLPFPQIVLVIAIILLIVGFAMIAGYIQKSSVQGMAFTLLIFALTAQNFFIYRDFWDRSGVNNPNAERDFSTRYYQKINYSNQGNSLQNPYTYTSASFLDAVGAAIAMYVAYSAVIGRISFGEIFFLTWIGPFFYQVNSQLLWRFYWPDTGYPSRAFAFGSALALVSSIILGKKDQTVGNRSYSSRYKVMGLALLGIIFVWCSFPIIVTASTYETSAAKSGNIVAMAGQVNIWMALAASVLGVFSACSIYYQKFSVHELVFSSITGAIAYSSTTDIDYNTGAAVAVGFGTGFLCCLMNMAFGRKVNRSGVVQSNSVIFHFLFPSFIAAIISAIAQGISNTATTYTTFSAAGVASSSITYSQLLQPGRTSTTAQGGYQILAWLLSIALGALAGCLIGFIYSFLNEQEAASMFNDKILYNYPQGGDRTYYDTHYATGPAPGGHTLTPGSNLYPKQSTSNINRSNTPQAEPNKKVVMLDFDVADY